MALLAYSGCDLESATGTNNTGKWVSRNGNSIFSSTGGPLSNNPVMESRLNASSSLVLPSSTTTLYFCGWLYCGSGVSSRIYFMNGSSISCRISIVTRLDGFIELYSSSDVLIASGEIPLKLSETTWYWFTGKVVFHTTAGSVECYINGNKGIDVTNVNTTSGNGSPNRVAFTSNTNSTPTVKYDDLFLYDGSGSGPFNNFIHTPMAVTSIMVDGDVGTPEWVPSSAGSNYQKVNTKPLVTTNYIASREEDVTDEFSFEDISVNPLAVQYNITYFNPSLVSTIDVSLDENSNINTTTFDIVNTGTVPTTITKIFEKTPNNSSWDTSKVNATKISITQNGV